MDEKSKVYEEAYNLIWNAKFVPAEALLKSHIRDDPWAGLAYFYVYISKDLFNIKKGNVVESFTS